MVIPTFLALGKKAYPNVPQFNLSTAEALRYSEFSNSSWLRFEFMAQVFYGGLVGWWVGRLLSRQIVALGVVLRVTMLPVVNLSEIEPSR